MTMYLRRVPFKGQKSEILSVLNKTLFFKGLSGFIFLYFSVMVHYFEDLNNTQSNELDLTLLHNF